MRWNRIDVKLGVTIILLFLIVLLPVGYVMNQIFSGFYFTKAQDDIDQLSAHYAEVIATTQNPVSLQAVWGDRPRARHRQKIG